MTTPNPTPEKQNPPPASNSEETRNPVDETSPRSNTGFFNRVRQELKSKPHPTQDQEIVVPMTPIKKTDSNEQT